MTIKWCIKWEKSQEIAKKSETRERKVERADGKNEEPSSLKEAEQSRYRNWIRWIEYKSVKD